MQAGVLHLCRWLTACVEGLPASPYDVRESLRSGRHRSGLGGRRSELVICGCTFNSKGALRTRSSCHKIVKLHEHSHCRASLTNDLHVSVMSLSSIPRVKAHD
ncbi:hypothetical protein HaLaN_24509 [Haematococcus lacustris]|uniref:Secreted protein n=1 Tax=Haematococcus lacustris TaxID=44745 RepID=A0A699ZYP4_HAELA|nr:hypothetical protein HaLaN_24509 [Haematococcus lacustris]